MGHESTRHVKQEKQRTGSIVKSALDTFPQILRNFYLLHIFSQFDELNMNWFEQRRCLHRLWRAASTTPLAVVQFCQAESPVKS